MTRGELWLELRGQSQARVASMGRATEMTGTAAPALLVEGQKLDQSTFHDRYEAMSPGTRAELINGVVYMPGPVGPEHGRALVPTLVWLSYYQENTPGVEVLDNTSTALYPKGEPQPDAQLRILPEYGGRTQTKRRLIRGVPEMVVEVSHASRFTDLGPKFDEYERVGVLEYTVLALEPNEILWFELRQGRLVELPPSSDGLFRSGVFPGLWLDPAALMAGDTRRLREVVDAGLATPEHAAFVARLAALRLEPRSGGRV
jgi:Putative restriction endonuclease